MTPVASSSLFSERTTPSSTTNSSNINNSINICIINPNSSTCITDALTSSLLPHTPPGCSLSFLTGPSTSPASIQTSAESVLSASETFKSLTSSSPNGDLSLHPADVFLVACFSDHPLVPMIRGCCSKPVLHLLEAAIIHALSSGTKFGILTTGKAVVPDVEAGVRRVLGGNSSRYVGTHATNLGVVELQSGSPAKVHAKIKEGTQELVKGGADVIILGCAGMTGMEGLVWAAAEEVGGQVGVIDGAKAGLQVLAGLGRVSYRRKA